MATSNAVHTYTELLNTGVTLHVTALESPYTGIRVELLGRRQGPDGTPLLLVRQELVPHLIEIPSGDTNIHEVEFHEGEPQKLVAQQLLKTAGIVAAAEERFAHGEMVEEDQLTRVPLRPIKFQHTADDFWALYQSSVSAVERRRAQFFALLAEGRSEKDVLEITKYASTTAQQIIGRYNTLGLASLQDKRIHQRGRSKLLTADE